VKAVRRNKSDYETDLYHEVCPLHVLGQPPPVIDRTLVEVNRAVSPTSLAALEFCDLLITSGIHK